MADRALAMAIPLARAFHARLTLLHVWTMPDSGYAVALDWPLEGMERVARRALADSLASARALYPKTDGMLREGHECREIMTAIREQGCDLVVMGTAACRGSCSAALRRRWCEPRRYRSSPSAQRPARRAWQTEAAR